MKKVTVLGAGLVGGPMAADLAADFDVTLVDRSPAALAAAAPGARVTRVEADLSGAAEVRRVSEGADVVLSAVPGFMGYRTLATLDPAPVAIGVGYELGWVATTHPQAYDRPMHWIVTEAGIHAVTR